VEAGEELDVTKGGRTLVSLGDSYMSGEGAERFFDGTNAADRNECRRAPSAYPHLIVEPGREGAFGRLAFLACSGATAANVYRRAQFPGEPIDDTPDAGVDQLAQLRTLLGRARVDIRLVVVSIGGNDAGFSDIGAACLAPGSCVERGHEWLERLDRVAENVGAAYREIRATVGREAPVLAIPYPQPIRDRPCDYSLLEQDEHRFLHGFVEQLDGVIRQAARDARFYFLDGMVGAFSDRLRICDGRREDMGVNFIALKSMNGLVDQAVNPAKWIHNSLHPNKRGHEAMTVALEEWLRSHRDPPAVPPADDLPAPFARRSLEQVMGAEVSYCRGREPEPAHCDRGDVAWTFTQIGILVARAAIPALVLAAGLWLLWLPVLEWTRPRWERFGDRIARRLLARL
jgi:lysophospholipase L1-like esterase